MLGSGVKSWLTPELGNTDSPGLPWVPRCPDQARYLIWHAHRCGFQGATAGVPFLAWVLGRSRQSPSQGHRPGSHQKTERAEPRPASPQPRSPQAWLLNLFDLSAASGNCSPLGPSSQKFCAKDPGATFTECQGHEFIEIIVCVCVCVCVCVASSIRLSSRNFSPWELPV